ncbi:MAG: flagellin [Methanoregula sp.]|nr:flagellin [Methanoregula sp.]
MKNLYSEDAFTGLEAAIVLIAFVVVAAVFSYVVLGAGFFTSQTAQATVHTGVQQASSSMELVGNVYGIGDTTTNKIKYINTTIALTAGGTPVDLSQMVVSYSDSNKGYNANVLPNIASGDMACPADLTTIVGTTAAGNGQRWCIAQKINNQTVGAMLENNAQFVIAVGMTSTADPNVKISVNFQPAIGAVLPITRTIPGGISLVQPLY